MDFYTKLPLEIKNQSAGDACVANAIASIGEDFLGEKVDANLFYQRIKDGQFGLKPKQSCQKAVDYGLPLQVGGTKKVFSSFHRVWCWNYFNGIRDIIINKKKSVITGCYWQPEWDKKKDGIVDGMYQNLKIFPHAFKVFGITEKNGIIYLVVQNSKGTNVGDNGIFYFPESIARNFLFAYYFN